MTCLGSQRTTFGRSGKAIVPRSSSHQTTMRAARAWTELSPGERLKTMSGVDDGLGEGLRRFLGQVMPNAARDQPVLVLA